MAMTRLSDPTPRMTLPRALLSEALRLARSPLTAVHLVCGLARRLRGRERPRGLRLARQQPLGRRGGHHRGPPVRA